MAFRGALSGFYIYLDCSYGSGRLHHEQGELHEHKALHGPHRDLVNSLTKYLWYPSSGDYNIGVPKVTLREPSQWLGR